jgi:cell division protein FtsB
MEKRYSTIIFVPHARARFRKLKVSHRFLLSIASLVTSSVCLSTFFSVQYFTAISQTHELSKLQRENRELQTANEQFSKSVESLRTQLRTVEDRTRKLAIIAGITTLDETSRGGVGGARQNEDIHSNPYSDDVDKMSFRSRRLERDLSVLEQKFVAQSHRTGPRNSHGRLRRSFRSLYGRTRHAQRGRHLVRCRTGRTGSCRRPGGKSRVGKRLRQLRIHLSWLRLLDALWAPLRLRGQAG